MSTVVPLRAGDRCLVRDRPWRVRASREIVGHGITVDLEALDGDQPATLAVVTPPEAITVLPNEAVEFSRASLDALAPWVAAHQLLAATLVSETGLLSGARFGRVSLEAYQLAPALRLLAKPRPRLLVADDVGLGKTIEAGLALLELMARGRARRILIVVPPGLLLQWQEELQEKFGLEFAVMENAAGVARAQTELPAGANPWDVLPRVLTSVDFLKKDAVRQRALRRPWDVVVVDEAHAVAESGTPANPYRTQRTRLGQALREGSRGLLLLTATPHNGYAHSFRSLVELVEPGGAALLGAPDRLQRRVQRAMIRRLKSQIVRRRPDGTTERVFPQRTVEGLAVRASDRDAELLRKVASYCSRTARSAEGEEDADLVTFAMQIVKKRSLSSRCALERTVGNRLDALRGKEPEAPPDRAEVRDLQAELPLPEAAAERTAERILRATVPRDERRRRAEMRALNAILRLLKGLRGPDPKIAALLGELAVAFEADPGDKVIVFTEYRDTLEAIREALDDTPTLARRYLVLRGGFTARKRAAIQAAFENPEIRVLLATDAASEGLNLQRACHRAIHFELPWNPNRLEQRNGRVDRYGQRHPPVIRYLYHAGSAEEDVLHQLVQKIERMHGDQVSTPDILGVLAGAEEIGRGLVQLDPERPDVAAAAASLVRIFDDRTAEFVRNVQPLVAAPAAAATGDLAGLLDEAQPLLEDDGRVEASVRALLGPAIRELDGPGLVRIEVPFRYRGPEVAAVYPRATFQRAVAVSHRATHVEFITPLHPLVRAMATEVRARLLHVYPDGRGLPARRLAARRVQAAEPPSAVFTFLGVVEGGGGLVDERMLAVRVSTDGRVLDVEDAALAHLEGGGAADVDLDALASHFASPLPAMARVAGETAAALLDATAERAASRRATQASALREDVETDLADRLREIDEEEQRARGLVDACGQRRLFADAETRPAAFEARRAAARARAAERREEIAEFAQVRASGAPRALGALLLVSAEDR